MRKLKVVNGEIAYLSDANDQTYGMWCPVSYDTMHNVPEGSTFHLDSGDKTTRLYERIDLLETWIAGIADDHPQIPDWIQQSARSLLAQEIDKLEVNQTKWISVKDRLPEYGQSILIVINGHVQPITYMFDGNDDESWYEPYYFDGTDDFIWDPQYITHWMPLPKPPNEI